MKKAIRPAIFKWRQTEPELILCAVRWYLRYSLSFRDVEELLSERGGESIMLDADLAELYHVETGALVRAEVDPIGWTTWRHF